VIVDKGVKQVGYHCNDPIPVDVEARVGKSRTSSKSVRHRRMSYIGA
jgi:hypothetical protein